MFFGNPNLRKVGEKIEYTQKMIDEIIKCKSDIIYFAENYFYIVTGKKGKSKIVLYEWQKKVLKAFVETPNNKRHCIVKIARQSGKALSLNTLILTTNGFVKLGELKVGDYIYGRDGKKTRINFITETMNNHDIYEVEFDNGEKIKADAEHLWTISNSEINRRKFKSKEITITTSEMKEMFERFQKSKKPGSVYINANKVLEFDKLPVSIDPYVLGLWIGDGNSSDGRITCHIDDYNFYQKEFEKKQIQISEFRPDKRRPNTGNFMIYGLTKLLRQNNLLKNKHIPDNYIFNSAEIRLDFLKGLMDSDGYICKRGSCCFYQSNIDIVKKVRLLLSTLGIKSTLNEKKTDYKMCYYVRFISENFKVFNLKRKLERQSLIKFHPKNRRIYISNIRKIKSEPVRCLQVDNNEHLFLCGETLVPTHNTTVSTIFLLWYALFNKDKTVAIVAHKQEAAVDILKRIKTAITMLPIWLQQGLTEDGWNKKSVVFENGSRILASATSAEALTSLTVNLLFLDEFAKVPPYIAEEFITSTYPVISSYEGNKIIMVSTPKGLNHFYEFWAKSIREENTNNFFPIRVSWWEVPGRDNNWKEQTISDIGPIRFAQEFQCKFLGSQSTLIDSDVLERISFKDPIATKWNGLLSIYKQPVLGGEYVLGVDTGKGIGKDYSVIQVLWIKNEFDIEQVAIYRNNLINPHDFAQVCVSVAKFYNNAHMMVENNDVGSSVADAVWHEFEYEDLINLDQNALGVRSTKKSKLKANMLLKEYLEKDKLRICDESTIYELSRFEEINPNVFAAGRHEHDDCVTSLLWALYFIQTDEYNGKSYETKTVEDEFNVQKGSWEEGNEEVELSKINTQKEQGYTNFEPSVVMDEDLV